MLIGVDFDNTIVCYDAVFRRLAIEHGLIAPDTNISKRALHDLLHSSDQIDLWTQLQGEAYGPRMKEAEAFPGAIDFFGRCRRAGISVRIISHRTRHPYRGPGHDLHQAARGWLAASGIDLAPSQVFFQESRQEKIARIISEGCTHFVEDLADVIASPDFPAGVKAILFDPDAAHVGFPLAPRAGSWAEVARLLDVPEMERR